MLDHAMPFCIRQTNCSATLLEMPASHFPFNAPAMEEFINGHCAGGLGTLTTETGQSVAVAAAEGFIVPPAVVAAAQAIAVTPPTCGAFDCSAQTTNTQVRATC